MVEWGRGVPLPWGRSLVLWEKFFYYFGLKLVIFGAFWDIFCELHVLKLQTRDPI